MAIRETIYYRHTCDICGETVDTEGEFDRLHKPVPQTNGCLNAWVSIVQDWRCVRNVRIDSIVRFSFKKAGTNVKETTLFEA